MLQFLERTREIMGRGFQLITEGRQGRHEVSPGRILGQVHIDLFPFQPALPSPAWIVLSAQVLQET